MAAAAEEAAFRVANLARLAEEARVEQMNAQRRRMRIAEHRRVVEELLAVKRAIAEQTQACVASHLCSC